jgi:hypothetical protein
MIPKFLCVVWHLDGTYSFSAMPPIGHLEKPLALMP